MERSTSWEANRFSASQEIPHILWNPKIHYRSHKCPPPVSNLSQLDPVYTPTFNFLKIHLNIIFPSTSGSSKWSPSFRFLHKNSLYSSLHTRYMPHPSNSFRFYHLNNFGWGEQINKITMQKLIRILINWNNRNEHLWSVPTLSIFCLLPPKICGCFSFCLSCKVYLVTANFTSVFALRCL